MSFSLDWRSCDSMSIDEELLKLEEWTREIYEEKKQWSTEEPLFLEIGCFHGRSTSILAQFGKVITIDLFSNIDVGIKAYDYIGQMHFTDFIKNMIRLELIDRVFPVVSTSNFLSVLPKMEFDVIFIDGDHHFDQVKKDIYNSLYHLSDKGLIIFHDYKRCPPFDINDIDRIPDEDAWVGVRVAVDELLELGGFEIKKYYSGIVALGRI